MTQKAQLKKYREDGGPDNGPSTPVVITGGGPIYDDQPGAGSFLPVNIASETELPFKMAETGIISNTWVASESEALGQITEVTINGQPVEGLTHPAVLSFRGDADQLLLMITEAPEGGGSQLTISVFDGSFSVTEAGRQPATWIRSSIKPPNHYHKLMVGTVSHDLSLGFNVTLKFEQS